MRDAEFTTEEVEQINDRCRNQLLTVKPVVYVVNLSQKDIVRKKNKYLPKVKAWIEGHGGGLMIPFSVEFEQNRWDAREDPAALASFMEDKAGSHMLPKIIKQGFKQLNLMNFYTAGDKECRSWTVYAGATAPQCAGVIHTDFERGFIKAEVVSYDDYIKYTTKPSEAEVKAAGKYRQEGKTYVMQDGDVVHFNSTSPIAKRNK